MSCRLQFRFVAVFLLTTILTINNCDGQIPNLVFSMSEELSPGYEVGDVVASARLKQRYGAYELLEFALLPGPYADYFQLDRHSGILSIIKVLDRDRLAPNIDSFSITLNAALRRPEFDQFKITVMVNDSNDNTPTFEQRQVTLSVSELAAAGVAFVLPAAKDPDSASNSIQDYRLVESFSEFEIRVTKFGSVISDVRLVLKEALDREKRKEYCMHIVASDGGEPVREGTATVTVLVLDANDNSPTFEQDKYEVYVPEDMELNSPFIRVHAVDLDDGYSGQVSYEFGAQTMTQYGSTFNLNSETGEIALTTRLQYDAQKPSYNLLVLARDMGPNSFSANAWVTINVIDVNDHAPKITVTARSLSGKPEIIESVDEAGTVVAYVTAQDEDTGSAAMISCTVNGSAFMLVPVDMNEYKLITRVVFDREMTPFYRINITCSDSGRPVQKTSFITDVSVIDVNDNSPQFLNNSYTVRLREGTVAQNILSVSASDADVGENAVITYHIFGTAEQFFKMNPTSGLLSAISPFDHETYRQFQFVVTAKDQGNPSRSSSTVIVVDIVDENDEAPTFDHKTYILEMEEEQPPGTLVGTVSAIDRDLAPFNRIRYRPVGPTESVGSFNVNPETGEITTRRPLDREHRAVYHMVIIASDMAEPFWSTSVNVTINIIDLNDNAPSFYYPSTGNGSIFLVSPRSRVGTKLTPIYASDKDAGKNAQLHYSMYNNNSNGLFSIDRQGGELSVARDLRNYTGQWFRVTVIVTDNGDIPLNSVIWLQINVNDSVALPISDISDIDGQKQLPISKNNVPWTGGLKKHELFIVLLGSLTMVLVIILLLAIICVRTLMIRRSHGDATLLSPTMKNKDNILYETANSPSSKLISTNNCPIKDYECGGQEEHEQMLRNSSKNGSDYVTFSGRHAQVSDLSTKQ